MSKAETGPKIYTKGILVPYVRWQTKTKADSVPPHTIPGSYDPFETGVLGWNRNTTELHSMPTPIRVPLA